MEQFDSIYFAYKASSVVGKVVACDIEHRVREACDVQDVATLRCLHRLEGLDVDADQLWCGRAASQPLLVSDKGFPSSHHTLFLKP